MNCSKKFLIMMVLILVPFSAFAGFIHQPFLGFDKLTKKVCEDSLGASLFSLCPTGIEFAMIGGKQVTLATDGAWHRVIYSVSTGDAIEKIEALEGFKTPQGISGGNDGLFYVADAGNNRIVRLYYTNEILYWEQAIGTGELNYPADVKRYGDKIYVADTYNSRIIRYGLYGENPLYYGSDGLGVGQFRLPRGITKYGNYIYIADTYNRRIVRLQETASGFVWLNSKTVPGAGTEIVDLEVDSHGYVYGVDRLNSRILKFSPDLSEFIASFGSYGTGPDQFKFPKAIWAAPETSKVVFVEQWDDFSGMSAWRLTVKVFNAHAESYDASDSDSLPIEFGVDNDAYITITIRDSIGTIVRNLWSKKLVSAGPSLRAYWDGKDVTGKLVLPGKYSIHIYPEDAFPGGHYEPESATITVTIKGTRVPYGYHPKNNEIWTKDKSPYVFLGNVYIDKDSTLIINPGTKVLAWPHDPSWKWCISVNGILQAIGNNVDSILFSSYKKEKDRQKGDWNGVFFEDSIRDSFCCLEFCGVRYSGGSGIFFNSGSGIPTIENCVISDNGEHGVFCNYHQASPKIINCKIIRNTNYGISTLPGSPTTTLPTISDCNISDNGKYPARVFARLVSDVSQNNIFRSNGIQGIEVHGDEIHTSGTWANCDPSGWVYDVIGNVYIGDPIDSSVVRIAPGVKLRFAQNMGMNVGIYWLPNTYGGLMAGGDALEKVIFTAMDTTKRWAGIRFDKFAIGDSCVLDNCEVSYATNPNIIISSSSPCIKNCAISKSASSGIDVWDYSTPMIKNCIISGNKAHGIHCTYHYASPIIEGCKIYDNVQYGVYTESGSPPSHPQITGCTIYRNGSYPLRIYASDVGLASTANRFGRNGVNGIEVLGDEIHTSGSWAKCFYDWVYDVRGNVYVGDATNIPVLTIAPGVKMRFAQSIGIRIGNYPWMGALNGGLIAGDTLGEKMIFTALDTTKRWSGIWFARTNNSESCRLYNCEVTYGSGYNVQCVASSPLIQNCVISHSGLGISCGYAQAGNDPISPLFKNCTIRDNTTGISCYHKHTTKTILKCDVIYNNDTGIYCRDNNLIDSCNIFGNSNYGVYNTSTNWVKAENCWWGDASGPYDPSNADGLSNQFGKGDKVSDYVDYEPYEMDGIFPVMVSSCPLATAYNNAVKIVREANTGKMHAVYTSGAYVYYTYSTDGGYTWAERQRIGRGDSPALALDSQGHPCLAWKYGTNLCYTRLASTWAPIDTMVLYVLSVSEPALATGKGDTAYLAWTQYYTIPHGEGDLIVSRFPLDNLEAYISDTLGFGAAKYPSPSLAIDFSGCVHLVWRRDDGEIYYLTRENGIWTSPLNLSNSPDSISQSPSINGYGNNIKVVWQEGSGKIYHRSKVIGEDWSAIEDISKTQQSCTFPVITDHSFILWSQDIGNNLDIYYSYFDTTTWKTPRNFSSTLEASNFPQGVSWQLWGYTNLFGIWTEGNIPPYSIRSNIITISKPPLAYYSANAGNPNPSPFTIQRDGYIHYGTEDYKTVDYDSTQLIYLLPNLNPEMRYRLELVSYYESGKKGGKDLVQRLDLDGLAQAQIKLKSGIPDTVFRWIPPAAYKDKQVIVSVTKIHGDFAVVSGFKLYQFEREEELPEAGSAGAAMTAGDGVEFLPKVFALSQSYPNPFNTNTVIRYQLPVISEVSLKVYNIQGQLVKTLVNEKRAPGYYTARWDGKNDNGKEVSSGVYFYRLNAGGFLATKKMILLR